MGKQRNEGEMTVIIAVNRDKNKRGPMSGVQYNSGNVSVIKECLQLGYDGFILALIQYIICWAILKLQ